MKNFYNNFSYFVGFLVLCVFIQMLLGAKVLEKFLWLVLFGMVITNANSFIKWLQSDKKTTLAEKHTQENKQFADDGVMYTGNRVSSSGRFHGGSGKTF